MARSFILGGVAGTNLATGKPYIRRIVREGGAGGDTRADGLTCAVIGSGDNQGALSFCTGGSGVTGTAATDGKGKSWGSVAGELLFVEFPSTTRTLSVAIEDQHCNAASHEVRCRVMLVAEGQRVNASSSGSAVYAAPVTNGNYIEIAQGDTATINARTKGVFLQIYNVDLAGTGTTDQASGSVLADDGSVSIVPSASWTGHANDAVVLLVTAVLDQDTSRASDVDFSTATINAAGTIETDKLTKIWGNIDGVG